MNGQDPNVEQLIMIAEALRDLNHKLVYVGGSATGLLVTDSGRSAIRATTDVDVVTEVATLGGYHGFSSELARAGFKQELNEDVVCRWRYNGVAVDVLPTNEQILGFSNRWFPEVVRDAVEYRLREDLSIQLISSPLLIATKLEAFRGRGNGQYGTSHDIEDIVVVVDGRPELQSEVESADSEIREYLREELDTLLGDLRFTDSLPWHLGPTHQDQARVPVVIGRLRQIVGI